MATTMPSESITGIVGSVIGAVVVIASAYGADIKPEVVGALTILVGWLATAVTLFVRRNRRRETAVVPEGTAPEPGQ